ncbi:MAG: helix-turn-helix domain-containing protein [Spirochaetota bacterium]
MEENEKKLPDESLKKIEQNPYDPSGKKPEDLVRIFYSHNVPLMPVVSRRGILLGVLKKDEVIRELSDIAHSSNQKIDELIQRLAKKMSLDELLPLVGNTKEFMVVNLFGEVQGRWSRIDLFSACERGHVVEESKGEIDSQKEAQVLEWMIYLILEHIPRALYAVNEKGKTIFYNSYFEKLYDNSGTGDVDVQLVEKTLADPEKNEIFTRYAQDDAHYFYNLDLAIYYEKIPMISSDRKVGYLYYCDNDINRKGDMLLPGIQGGIESLKDILDSVERHVIVEAIKHNDGNTGKAADMLQVSRSMISKKIKKHAIDIDEQ